jgi:diaminopimelate decarboxylase
MHKLNFLTQEQINEIKSKYKLPLYVYSEEKLIEFANNFKFFPSAF